METKLKLTLDNYYTPEADMAYMSVSQYKNFLKCEAYALAKAKGEFTEEKSDALLFGSYVHSWLDGTVDQFREQNPELFSGRGATKGQLKAQYKAADAIIEVIKNDPFVMMALEGQKEVIMTGELFGVMWKIRIDVYNPEQGRFADLKTVQDIYKRYYDPVVGYCSFVEAFGYVTQMAVYSEIERQYRGGSDWLEHYIVAVSKEDWPNKEIITIDPERLAIELEEIDSRLERITQVKEGAIEPKRCGKCAYCRRTKRITSVISYMDLII